MDDIKKRSGFVSLIGRPSSGKSTLINAVCGHKICIVSDQPQTTQFIVRGIYNDDESQIIFIDTPGYHKFNADLNKGLSKLAVRTLSDGDVVLYVVDISREFGDEENEIISNIKRSGKPVVVAFNKTDLLNKGITGVKDEVIRLMEGTAKAFVEISAKTESNIKELVNILKGNLPEGPMYYPPEFVTDQSIAFRIKEIVREKVFNNTREEIPHAVYIDIKELDVSEEKIRSKAVIFVEKESQKGMVIGKGGRMIKVIGQEARKDLADIFEKEMELFLNVEVDHNWKKKESFLKKRFEIE